MPVNVFDPMRLMLRLLNVATPDDVVRVSVPLRTPVPEARAIVTDVPVVVTRLPNASVSATVTAGEMTAPAVAFEGCWTNARRAAAAGLIMIFLDVSGINVPLLKRMEMVSATLCDRLENVTVPLLAVAERIPCSVPVPDKRAAVTTVLLSVVIRFPPASSTLRIGCWENATPAVADDEGSVVMRSRTAGPSVIVKVLLVADVSPDAAALNCFEPMRLMLNPSNVARPEALVKRVVVPLSVPILYRERESDGEAGLGDVFACIVPDLHRDRRRDRLSGLGVRRLLNEGESVCRRLENSLD